MTKNITNVMHMDKDAKSTQRLAAPPHHLLHIKWTAMSSRKDAANIHCFGPAAPRRVIAYAGNHLSKIIINYKKINMTDKKFQKGPLKDRLRVCEL